MLPSEELQGHHMATRLGRMGMGISHPIPILIIVSLAYPEMVSAANHWELWEFPLPIWWELGMGMGKNLQSHPDLNDTLVLT